MHKTFTQNDLIRFVQREILEESFYLEKHYQ